jgi:hypothetical protein
MLVPDFVEIKWLREERDSIRECLLLMQPEMRYLRVCPESSSI